jgi:nucleotide-binding universal stress UspA family protein
MTIVVGVDGSEAAREALGWALAEGRLRGAPVRAVYAWELTGELAAPGPLLGGPLFGSVSPDPDELRRSAELRLKEIVDAVVGSEAVERVAVQGHTAQVLVEQARAAELLVVGSRGHGGLAGALLGSVSHACAQHASCPVVIVRRGAAQEWHPDEVIAREVAQNRETWAALQRLGVTEGAELRLEFVYESGGEAADRELAEYLRRETGYEVRVEPGGVTGATPPTVVDPQALDDWVARMVVAGHEHGGCAFDGWTATVSAGRE